MNTVNPLSDIAEINMSNDAHTSLCVELPSISSPGLQFKVWSEERLESDECRVAQILRSIWQRISPAEQRQLATYFVSQTPNDPEVRIVSKWWWDPKSDANAELSGKLINLNWTNVRHAPDCVIEVLLAHELAHSLQFATGKHRLAIRKEDLLGRIEIVEELCLGPVNLVEIHADETIIGWGYDPLKYLAWMTQNMEDVEGRPKLRKKPLSEKVARRKAEQIQFHTYHRKYP